MRLAYLSLLRAEKPESDWIRCHETATPSCLVIWGSIGHSHSFDTLYLGMRIMAAGKREPLGKTVSTQVLGQEETFPGSPHTP